MTEDDTFRHLKRMSYQELKEYILVGRLSDISNLETETCWSPREYLEAFYEDASKDNASVWNQEKEVFVIKWLARWNIHNETTCN